MSLDQHDLILRAFKAGTVQGLLEPGIPPEHIRTFISDVFLFPSTVYKIYRRDNQDFNKDFINLDNIDIRRAFYKEDFRWNQYFNPSVYQQLQGIEVEGETTLLTEEMKTSSERVIQMRRIDAVLNLTRQLLEGRISEADAFAIGSQLTKKVDQFPWREPSELSMLARLELSLLNLERWSLSADPAFPRALTDRAIHSLRGFVQSHQDRFSSLQEDEMVPCIDSHSDNLFFEGGTLSCIDIYLMKPEWRLMERSYSVYRLAMDIEVLGNKSLSETFIEGCVAYYGPRQMIRPEVQWFYQLFSALIKSPYLFSLAQKDPARLREAQLYQAFIERMLE
ncbi:hypothetical protein KBD61_02735 [Patescibacteria group bacterium]|nr:hypothetical protein [Patescibacteria group bacterium]MBP9709921.1 hypothetical protein [Patescibacteria group bacterium]